ncbi:YchJ family protein [Corynebacterium lubricantis]|uniref:YchJ family protein n=1 Tax=Corynebacterium lubricantis TaxID=541095 RepID=UPI0004779FFC|nr:YchJ family metal-binding protein [Corynebacterium lubricantis]
MTCYCGSGLAYKDCCGQYHAGKQAPTAETLMRSRFSAFATGNSEYLLRTWAPESRPGSLDLSGSPVQWERLVILDKQGGGLFDTTGIVEFEAFYKGGSQRERSSFRRLDDGSWVYAEGDVS